MQATLFTMLWWAEPQRHTVVGVCVCVYLSVTSVSWRPLQGRHCQVQCRHNVTISQTYTPLLSGC